MPETRKKIFVFHRDKIDFKATRWYALQSTAAVLRQRMTTNSKMHYLLSGTQYCWTELQWLFLATYDNKKDGRVMIIAGLKVRSFKDAWQETEI
jgi:hypothetical protein